MPSREAQKDLQPSHGPFFFCLKPVNPPLFEGRSPNLTMPRGYSSEKQYRVEGARFWPHLFIALKQVTMGSYRGLKRQAKFDSLICKKMARVAFCICGGDDYFPNDLQFA